MTFELAHELLDLQSLIFEDLKSLISYDVIKEYNDRLSNLLIKEWDLHKDDLSIEFVGRLYALFGDMLSTGFTADEQERYMIQLTAYLKKGQK